MIRSKIDALKEERLAACNRLENALTTKRGSKEARDEAHDRRRRAAETGLCCSCDAVILDKSAPEHANSKLLTDAGNCSYCDAAIKRMLVFKSKLHTAWPSEKLLRRFIEDYNSIPNLPYALRGSVPRDEVLMYAEELLHIVTKLTTEVKRAEARNRKA